MPLLYRVVYTVANGPQADRSIVVSATTQQNAHDAAKAADTKWNKVTSITQIGSVDVVGS